MFLTFFMILLQSHEPSYKFYMLIWINLNQSNMLPS